MSDGAGTRTIAKPMSDWGWQFEIARALIEARRSAGFTQAELAARMKTTQSAVARLESGRIPPSTRTLEKVAKATGTRLRIRFEPACLAWADREIQGRYT